MSVTLAKSTLNEVQLHRPGRVRQLLCKGAGGRPAAQRRAAVLPAPPEREPRRPARRRGSHPAVCCGVVRTLE